MIGLLIWALVFLIVVHVVRLIIDALGLPDNIRQIVYIIFGLIALLSLLSQFGLVSGIKL